MLYEDLARCDIIDFHYPPPDAGGCEGAWGDSLSVGPNAVADFVCHGDTAIDPAAMVLDYSHSLMAGSLLCMSERRGITCEDVVSGSGFTLSRERVDLY